MFGCMVIRNAFSPRNIENAIMLESKFIDTGNDDYKNINLLNNPF